MQFVRIRFHLAGTYNFTRLEFIHVAEYSLCLSLHQHSHLHVYSDGEVSRNRILMKINLTITFETLSITRWDLMFIPLK